MPKWTIEQLTGLLAVAGVPHVEITDDEAESDFDADAALQSIDSVRSQIIAPKLLAEKTGELHKQLAGRINGSLRSQLSQKTGIVARELEGLDSKEMIEKAFGHFLSIAAKDTEELIQERDQLLKDQASREQQLNADWQQKLQQANDRYIAREITEALHKDHREARGLPKDANRLAMAEMFKDVLAKQYLMRYDEETKQVLLYDKQDPEQRVYTNDTKTSYLKPADVMTAHYKKLNLWNEDNRGINPQEAMTQQPLKEYKSRSKAAENSHPTDQKNSAMLKWASGEQ
jgi:hypothetical protein